MGSVPQPLAVNNSFLFHKLARRCEPWRIPHFLSRECRLALRCCSNIPEKSNLKKESLDFAYGFSPWPAGSMHVGV